MIFETMQRMVRTDFLSRAYLCLLLPIGGICAQAQDQEGAANPRLSVQVRTVRADGAVEPLERANAEAPAPSIDGEIQDLAPQLQRLNYNSFRLLERHDLILPSRKKQTIALSGGDSLTLRPLGVEGDKICVWLKWRDKSGMELLDTRMRFVAGESMITGTDHTPDSGLILAIKVRPIE